MIFVLQIALFQQILHPSDIEISYIIFYQKIFFKILFHYNVLLVALRVILFYVSAQFTWFSAVSKMQHC